MSVDFHVIIPARYQSTRLPGKLLMELGGLTVLERVYQQAKKANPKSIIIATDNEKIAAHAKQFGANVQMTASTHQSGTDRIAEIISACGFLPDDVIVNVQGDEPFIEPALISQVVRGLIQSQVSMSTLCWPIENEEQLTNPNIVKVVRNQNNHALYFSRSKIPAYRDQISCVEHAFRHIGLYAYRASFLLDFASWPVCKIEAAECIEQLRVLWAGYPIYVEEACIQPLQDINTEDDLFLARELVQQIQG